MSRFPGKVDRRLIALGVLAAILIVGYAAAISYADTAGAEGAPPGSTFNEKGSGSQVLLSYLEGMDIEVLTLRQFEELPEEGTIIVIAPDNLSLAPTRAEGRRLRTWVEEGGRVVLVGPHARSAFEGSAIGAGQGWTGEPSTLEPVQPSVYMDDVALVEVGPERILPSDPAWVPHLKDGHGHALTVRTLGEGEIAWLASAYPTSSEGIGEFDNARLSTLLAAMEDPVYFDEYHHGYVRGSGMWTRMGASGQAAVLLVALAVVIAIVASTRRVGPAITPPQERTVRTGAYIGQLASLYRKAGARAEALDSLADGLRSALARRYGTVDAGLSRCEEARTALERLNRLESSGGQIPEEVFVSVARDITRARRDVEGRDG